MRSIVSGEVRFTSSRMVCVTRLSVASSMLAVACRCGSKFDQQGRKQGRRERCSGRTSSMMSNLFLRRMARAMQISCFSPWEKFSPFSLTTLSRFLKTLAFTSSSAPEIEGAGVTVPSGGSK